MSPTRRTTKDKPKLKIGRPSKIHDTIEVPDTDGGTRTVTIADRIVELLRTGIYIEQATATTGISKQTVYAWLKGGASVRARLAAGTTAEDLLSEDETAQVNFLDAVDRAQAEWEIQTNVLLDRIGRGGLKEKVVTIERDSTGDIIKSTTREADLLPDAATLRWRLERKFPDRYGRRLAIEGTDGPPIKTQNRVEGLLNLLDEIQQGGSDGSA